MGLLLSLATPSLAEPSAHQGSGSIVSASDTPGPVAPPPTAVAAVAAPPSTGPFAPSATPASRGSFALSANALASIGYAVPVANPPAGVPAQAWAPTLTLAPTSERPTSQPAERSKVKSFGASADVGFPDGAILSLAYRPIPCFRVQAGAGTNSVSPGLRGGVVFVPFRVGPSIALEAGYYVEGNANGIAATIAGSSYENNRIAERIGYEFASVQVGLELGGDAFSFYLRGGMSYARARLHNVNEVFGSTSTSAGATTTLAIGGEPVVTALLPSLKLGFILFFV